MKKLILLLGLAGFAFSIPSGAYAGEKDCKDNEKWNEQTQKCELKP